MSDLDDFQREHGERWTQITDDPACGNAMLVLNLEAIDKLLALTTEEIRDFGVIHLAEFIGQIKHENGFMRLASRKQFQFGTPVAENYPSPAEEAAELAAQEAQEKQNPSTTNQVPKTPRRKKR